MTPITKPDQLPPLALSPHTAAQYQRAIDAAKATGEIEAAMSILASHVDPAVRQAGGILERHITKVWDVHSAGLTRVPVTEPDCFDLVLAGDGPITVGSAHGRWVQIIGGLGLALTVERVDDGWEAYSTASDYTRPGEALYDAAIWSVNGEVVLPNHRRAVMAGETIRIGANLIRVLAPNEDGQ